LPRKSDFAGHLANREEMAGILGISPTTLDRYVALGCPISSRGTVRREYRFNSAQVIAWRDERKAAALAAENPAAATVTDAKKRHAMAVAELVELKLAERRGQMIAIDDVLPAISEQLAAVRSRLLAMPGRLAQSVAAMSDPLAVERAVNDEIISALSELTSG
jgi:terminase small subunit / prophage DNA-packing protein